MSEQTPNPASKGLARRRLLRGTFAAPAVLTLYSGGALAATSATCVAKAQGSKQTGEVVEGTPSDTFIRVQLYQVTADTVTTYWLAGDSISAFKGASSIVNAGKYTRFLVESNALSEVAAEVNQDLTTPTISAKSVALRFNGDGTLVGVGLGDLGSAITHSCWTSIY